MANHIFSENQNVEDMNRRKGLIDRPIYIPRASKSNKDIIIHNNKTRVLHTHCRTKGCGVKLEGKIWQFLGICPMCDLN